MRDNIIKAYNYLASDLTLLEDMNLTKDVDGARVPLDPKTIDLSILKVRQNPRVSDKYPKLAIWSSNPLGVSINRELRVLVVDVYVPLALQAQTGVAFQISERIQKLLNKKPIGTGLIPSPIRYDLSTIPGWYKASVPFIYHYINKLS
jgi:hypothetical protein